jgi:hypothetical protein
MMVLEVIAGLVVLAICAGCALMLWAFLRFGIVSEWRMRGWRGRLGRPRLDEVEAEWQVRLPRALDPFYRSSGVVERGECYLGPPGAGRPLWYVAQFIPLTRRDVAEWMKVTGVPGIPLALDDSKGVYYLPFAALRCGEPPPVLLREPGPAGQDREVAPSVEDFVRFQPAEVPEEDDGDGAAPGTSFEP